MLLQEVDHFLELEETDLVERVMEHWHPSFIIDLGVNKGILIISNFMRRGRQLLEANSHLTIFPKLHHIVRFATDTETRAQGCNRSKNSMPKSGHSPKDVFLHV